jgi:hypothetical protein
MPGAQTGDIDIWALVRTRLRPGPASAVNLAS